MAICKARSRSTYDIPMALSETRSMPLPRLGSYSMETSKVSLSFLSCSSSRGSLSRRDHLELSTNSASACQGVYGRRRYDFVASGLIARCMLILSPFSLLLVQTGLNRTALLHNFRQRTLFLIR